MRRKRDKRTATDPKLKTAALLLLAAALALALAAGCSGLWHGVVYLPQGYVVFLPRQ